MGAANRHPSARHALLGSTLLSTSVETNTSSSSRCHLAEEGRKAGRWSGTFSRRFVAASASLRRRRMRSPLVSYGSGMNSGTARETSRDLRVGAVPNCLPPCREWAAWRRTVQKPARCADGCRWQPCTWQAQHVQTVSSNSSPRARVTNCSPNGSLLPCSVWPMLSFSAWEWTARKACAVHKQFPQHTPRRASPFPAALADWQADL